MLEMIWVLRHVHRRYRLLVQVGWFLATLVFCGGLAATACSADAHCTGHMLAMFDWMQ